MRTERIIIFIFVMSGLAFACHQKSGMRVEDIVYSFEKSRNLSVAYIEAYPVFIGPDRFTLKNTVMIKNKNICRNIVDLISFPESPDLPDYLDHAGFREGCGIKIVFDNRNEYDLMIEFRVGGRGYGVDYKISTTNRVRTTSDIGLADNYVIGHGFNQELYDVLKHALKSAQRSKIAWVPSKWE